MSDSNRLQKLMLMAATLMSREDIIKKLKEDLEKYDNATGEEKSKAYSIVEGDCLLLATKRVTENESMDEIEKTMRQVSSIVSARDGNNNNKT